MENMWISAISYNLTKLADATETVWSQHNTVAGQLCRLKMTNRDWLTSTNHSHYCSGSSCDWLTSTRLRSSDAIGQNSDFHVAR